MSQYRLARRAAENLERITNYIAAESPSAAERVVDALVETFSNIAEFPHLGTLRDDLRPDLRMANGKRPAQNYLVFYYEVTDGVEISAIIHGARDMPAMFEDREV